jgi:hypothetical protein
MVLKSEDNGTLTNEEAHPVYVQGCLYGTIVTLSSEAGSVILSVPAHIWSATRVRPILFWKSYLLLYVCLTGLRRLSGFLRHIQNASAKRLKKYGRPWQNEARLMGLMQRPKSRKELCV